MTDRAADRITNEVFNSVSECHFARGKQAVCSPKNVINKMKQFAKDRGHDVQRADDHAVVQTVKDLLDCNSESCILRRKDFVTFAQINQMEDILDRFFKPSGPATNFGLLSNFNIDDVLDQFEEKFADRKFLHIPFQMRDFEKVGTQLATIDLAQKFQDGTRCFGVVLNTDYSTGGGIHWFCLFGEHLGKEIVLEYFNSSGKEPLPEIQAWLQKNKHYISKTLDIPVRVHYSTGIQFQNDDHSCGVYCLCYIWLRLEGISPQWFKSDNFNDGLMHRARKNLFRHH